MPKRYDRRGSSISEMSQGTGLSEATIKRWTSRTRAEWIQEKAAEREEIRAFHDEQGHSWTETAARYRLDVSTVKRRAYRARKERADEQSQSTSAAS
jgi:DNA-directed RNA polymerase specialized sigma24 family protein